jgi:preprotein translocase subunit SecB
MKHLQLDYIIKQVPAALVRKQDDVNMVMAIKIGKRSTDEFEIRLRLKKGAETDKPQWVAIDYDNAGLATSENVSLNS